MPHMLDHTFVHRLAGDEVKVREADFIRLSDGFFREIEKK